MLREIEEAGTRINSILQVMAESLETLNDLSKAKQLVNGEDCDQT